MNRVIVPVHQAT